MKIKNILLLTAMSLCTLAWTSCMDKDWESPIYEEAPYGNNSIKETNPITIAQLKQMYPKYAENYNCTLMNQEAQLKVYVTGNDIAGNLYNSISVQDENGDALIVAISEGSLYGYLPVGQELLIETSGLYIGGYGSQPQIGMPYTNASGNTYVSRMSSSVWQSHFKILPTKKAILSEEEYSKNPIEDAYVIPAYTVDEFKKLNIESECGKLMTLKGVSIKGADGKKTWANSADAGSQTSVTLYFNELTTKYEVYTSTYCDFANDPIPTGKLNLTGVWKRYNTYWELIIRDTNDIELSDER